MLETSAAKCKDVQKDKRRNSILEMFFAAERKEKKKKGTTISSCNYRPLIFSTKS
jgi:hypothetical protein